MTVQFDKSAIQEKNGYHWLCLRVTDEPAARRAVFEISQGKLMDAELKPHHEKRSLDANAYAWALISKLAEKIGTDKDTMYLIMLDRYGQGGIAKIKDKDIDRFRQTVDYMKPHESLPREEKAAYYRFFVGSSKYNTEEMSIFIDGIVSDCKEQGIETMTPAEIMALDREAEK